MITLIAAVSKNGIIGDSTLNSMPWYCKEELKHFKKTTMGGTLVMGRITAEQVGKLPGRDAIVLSRDPNYKLDGFDVMTIDTFLKESVYADDYNYYICGGAEIYKQLGEYCDKMIISFMKFDCTGDISFPDNGWDNYIITNYTKHEEFITYYMRKSTT